VAGDGRPSKEPCFGQQHHPGRLNAYDFVHSTDLAIIIQNQTFPHLLYHFVLTYSNWETGTVCFSESFESLCEGVSERDLGMFLSRQGIHLLDFSTVP
jgi:hypothetical protein